MTLSLTILNSLDPLFLIWCSIGYLNPLTLQVSTNHACLGSDNIWPSVNWMEYIHADVTVILCLVHTVIEDSDLIKPRIHIILYYQ